ncbi:MAG TPA: hypothetical protein VHF69_00045, partial [Candidatus Synoicihabitans sp.]|nr:hypothetical protein [Candidatus Synoicihabitans sp.]
ALLNGARTDLASGWLWLYASPAHRYRDLLKTAIDAWRQGLHRAPQLEVRRAPAFSVATERDTIHAALDGELALLDTPLRFRSCPGGLTVLAPPPET